MKPLLAPWLRFAWPFRALECGWLIVLYLNHSVPFREWMAAAIIVGCVIGEFMIWKERTTLGRFVSGSTATTIIHVIRYGEVTAIDVGDWYQEGDLLKFAGSSYSCEISPAQWSRSTGWPMLEHVLWADEPSETIVVQPLPKASLKSRLYLRKVFKALPKREPIPQRIYGVSSVLKPAIMPVYFHCAFLVALSAVFAWQAQRYDQLLAVWMASTALSIPFYRGGHAAKGMRL